MYIELKKALHIVDTVSSDEGIKKKCKAIRKRLKELPTEDVEKVRHGEWIPTEYDGYADGCPVWDLWECSECHEEHRGDEETLTYYCPHCGAKMDGKEGAEE